MVKVLLYTVTLIVTIALTLSLMTFGERALWYTVEHFHLPEFLAKLWDNAAVPRSRGRQLSGTVPALCPGPGYPSNP